MKGFVYLNHPSEISEASRDSANVRERARTYLINRFGFDYDDFALGIQGFGMWRQFFGIHLENAVVETICNIHGFERFDLTYLMDGFSTRNPFKVSLLRLRVLRESGRKAELLTYWLADEFLENQVIEDISAFNGLERAYVFHRRLMRKMGYVSKSRDISELLVEFTKQGLENMRKGEALKIFNRLFVLEKAGNIRVRRRYDYSEKIGAYTSKDNRNVINFDEMIDLAERDLVLPSSETYYSHFFFFIPGILEPDFVQIEAEFETADSEILRPALEGFCRVKRVTGHFPLIIPIRDFNAWDEIGFTKNPGCVCVCMNVGEMTGRVENNRAKDMDFVELSNNIATEIISSLQGFS